MSGVDKTPRTGAGRGLVGSPAAGNRGETPFGRGLPLGRWRGVPVRAHWSVLIVLGLFAWLLAELELPAMLPGQARTAYWITGVISAPVFFATLFAHELAHAVTSRHYGMRVERITLWMLGGMTELDGEPPSPKADALIAASGPATSLVVAGASWGLYWVIGGQSLVVVALLWLAEINLVLAVFNLLPGAPLDGGRLLRALLWWRYRDRVRATRAAAAAGRGLGFALVALGLLQVLAGGPFGLWLALVGWFIVSGANSERYAVHAERLRGLRVRDAIGHPPVTVGDWWTVQQFLDRLTPQQATQPAFPLVDVDGRLTGVIGVSNLAAVPPELRPTTRLSAVPGRPAAVVEPDVSLPDVMLSLHVRGGTVIVVDQGRPIGVLTFDDLTRDVQLAQLGWSGSQRPDA